MKIVRTKVTPELVEKCKKLIESNKYTRIEIYAKTGLSLSTISRVRKGEYDYMLEEKETILCNGIAGEVLTTLAEFETKMLDILAKYEGGKRI